MGVIGRPEGRGADRADIAPGDGSEHRRAIDIADLALIGRHAERGIALEMLGDAKALARGKLHVGHRHVVLEIDEGLAPALRRPATPGLPRRFHRRASARACCWGGETAFGGGLGALFLAFGETGGEAECAVGRAGHAHARRHGPGDKRCEAVVPLRLAVEMGGQVERGVPAARHGDEIAGDALASALRVPDRDPFDAKASAHAFDDRAGEIAGLRRVCRLLRGS